jgi:hypothetical protein
LYITNPSDQDLNDWYKTKKKRLINYLLSIVPVVHVKDGYYYFVRSELLDMAFENAPWYLKLLKF